VPLYRFEIRAFKGDHLDPPPLGFTYGEPRVGEIHHDNRSRSNTRAKQPPKLRKDDLFFFVSSLFDPNANANQYPLKKYLVGGMRINEVFGVSVRRGELTGVTDANGTIVNPETEIMSQIRSSPHSRRDEEDFWCAVGQKEGRTNILFKRAVPLTEGSDFRPNRLGIQLYGNVIYQRGFKPKGWTGQTNKGRYDWLWECLRDSGQFYT